MKRLDEDSRATRFGELVDAYEKEHFDGWSKNYKTKWSWFLNAVEELRDSITLPMDGAFWSRWMREKAEEKEWSDGTYNDLLSLLRAVWKYGLGLSLVDRNPIEGLRRRKVRRTDKAVYTVDQVKALMNCAWEHDREMVPYFAIALFAGLRPDVGSEICGLTWEDINFEERWIRVGAGFDNKTGTKRFVPLEDNLAQWLDSWKEAHGPVVPRNLSNRRRWIVRGKYQAEEKAPETEWKELVPSGMDYRDVTRHTYGSYLEAKYKDRNIVKENMGHTSFTTYEQHYRNARTPKEAEQYWTILPPEDPESDQPPS
jgi:integrase